MNCSVILSKLPDTYVLYYILLLYIIKKVGYRVTAM